MTTTQGPLGMTVALGQASRKVQFTRKTHPVTQLAATVLNANLFHDSGPLRVAAFVKDASHSTPQNTQGSWHVQITVKPTDELAKQVRLHFKRGSACSVGCCTHHSQGTAVAREQIRAKQKPSAHRFYLFPPRFFFFSHTCVYFVICRSAVSQ